MKICSLSSGSSGNCVFLRSGDTRLLVDAGVSGKRIEQELYAIGESAAAINGILVTHEHVDHIKSIAMLSKKYKIPLYGTSGTFYSNSCFGKGVPTGVSGFINLIKPGEKFMVGTIAVKAFRISHDAADPVAYTFVSGEHKIGFATDLGFYDDSVVENLSNSDVLYLESNHDVNMLDVGRYPYPLKQRIKSNLGHLSNDSCAELVVTLCREAEKPVKHVILAHLSEENNFPELALATVEAEVKMKLPDERIPAIHVAPRNEHSFIAET